MNLQQALKYSTVKAMVRASFNATGDKGKLFVDPIHTLVTADALQEQGLDGMAHLLRVYVKNDQQNRGQPDGWGNDTMTKKGPPFGDDLFEGSVEIVGPYPLRPRRAKEDDHRVRIALVAHHPDTTWQQHAAITALDPQEAKEATARLPNAAQIHKFIDYHFNAPTEAQ